MRAVGVALGLALVLVLPPVSGPAASADEGRTPSRQEVRDARAAARDTARDVTTVQAELASANALLQQSAVKAAQATEAWNGARYRLDQARQAAVAAQDRAGIARTDVDRQQDAYADALITSYEMAPALTAVASMVHADGISTVVEQTTTMRATESALDTRYGGFLAASTLAGVALDQATDAAAEAQALQVEAREARDAARAAAAAAAAEAQAVASRKTALIAELAELQDISVRLAEQRQADLEQRAAEAAAEAAAQAADEQAAQEAAEQAPAEAEQQEQADGQEPAPQQPAPQQPEPEQPEPEQPAPAPSGGASAAISFARAQLGEPYRWGAAGPDAWDCSGLTMGAWSAGGSGLPHYSVAQYQQSTPVSAGSLQPGDLVFWGSSSSSSSIYHVALYVGGGQIIHAPRTGRPVVQESMYYWTSPNFYARP
ncbi:MAG: C40 family peptidase [Nocardioides sp.]